MVKQQLLFSEIFVENAKEKKLSYHALLVISGVRGLPRVFMMEDLNHVALVSCHIDRHS